jgi:signal transduction histidine kinase
MEFARMIERETPDLRKLRPLQQLSFSLVLLWVLGVAPVCARVFEINPGVDNIQRILSKVASGDSIKLTRSGTYLEHGEVILPAVPLTILAPPELETKPVLKSQGLLVRSDFRLQSVVLDGGSTAKYGVRSIASKPISLVVEHCNIRKIVADALSSAIHPIAWCEIRNSVFNDIGGNAVGLDKGTMAGVLQVSNSTFHRLGGAAVDVSQGLEPLLVRISDVTIHDAGHGILIDQMASAEISGVILSGIREKVATETDRLIFRNSCVFDSKKHQHIDGARCLNCLDADPEFYDPEDHDFSLLPESPCLWLGQEHTPIGDPRWTGKATRIAQSKRDTATAVRWSGGVGGVALAVVLIFSAMRRYFHRSTSASLSERDASYRVILEDSSDGIVFFDPHSRRILEMNGSLMAKLDLPGWPSETYRVESLFDEDEELENLFEAADSGRSYSAHHRLRLADGSLMDADLDAHTMEYRGSKTVCLVTHDISRWTNETRKLIEVEEQLQHLLSSSPAVLYSRPLERPFGFTFVSASVENLLQFQVSVLLSDPEYFKWRIHMEDLPRVMGEQQRVLGAGKQAQEYRIQIGDGTYRWIRDETYLVVGDNGESVEIVGTIVDVTTRVQAEQSRVAVEAELEQQKALSMRADRLRSLSEMAAGIDLHTNLGESLPQVCVNPYSIEEVVLNLIVNARDALENRDGNLEAPVVEIRTSADDAEYVRISVDDNGCGIPLEIQERVWQPFFTTKDPDRGTGLGLAISRTIVEEAGGRLELDSQTDRGTTVTIVLPSSKPEDEAASSVATTGVNSER